MSNEKERPEKTFHLVSNAWMNTYKSGKQGINSAPLSAEAVEVLNSVKEGDYLSVYSIPEEKRKSETSPGYYITLEKLASE